MSYVTFTTKPVVFNKQAKCWDFSSSKKPTWIRRGLFYFTLFVTLYTIYTLTDAKVLLCCSVVCYCIVVVL